MNGSRLLRIDVVAQLYDVTSRTVENWIAWGYLTTVRRPNGCVLVAVPAGFVPPPRGRAHPRVQAGWQRWAESRA